jgi:MEDS: MEthanogen/methylotroph, DcmR Sensory domain
MSGYRDGISANVDVFWTEIAYRDHVLQLYKSDGVFLDALAGFVLEAFHSQESAIVIATNAHLNALESRLRSYGYDIEKLISEHRFIPLNAEETVSEFMINGVPDEATFKAAANKLFYDAGYGKRPVRVAGEGTALLWKHGYKDAAIRLEQLWHEFQKENPHSLFCGYAEAMFENDVNAALPVCNAHSKMISGAEKQITHVFYSEIEQNQVS